MQKTVRKKLNIIIIIIIEVLECQGIEAIFASDPGEVPFENQYRRVFLNAYSSLGNCRRQMLIQNES